MCDHCFNASDFQLPSGVNICTDCFHESYCRICWQNTNVVGITSLHNDMMLCTTCINNYNTNEVDDMDAEIMDGDMDETDDEIYYNIHENIQPIVPIINIIPLHEPPAGFDMNMASLVEENPDYMENLINAQIEYDGNWYFTLDGQIYSVPYEIEIDDNYVRRDIIDNWDGVQWRGTIFGNYIAWY